jgi:hypothetical protein
MGELFGNLKLARKVNSNKEVSNTILIVIAKNPTTNINGALSSYHWYAAQDPTSMSYFGIFSQIEYNLIHAAEEGWTPVVCAPTKAIAFALSHLREIGDPDGERSLAAILADQPKLAPKLPRNFRLELTLFHGWARKDQYCADIANQCWDERNKFRLDRLLGLSFSTVSELELHSQFVEEKK